MLDWLRYHRDGSELRIDPYVIESGRLCLGSLLCTVVFLSVLVQFEPDGTIVVSMLWTMLLLFVFTSMLLFMFGGAILIAYGIKQLVTNRMRG